MEVQQQLQARHLLHSHYLVKPEPHSAPTSPPKVHLDKMTQPATSSCPQSDIVLFTSFNVAPSDFSPPPPPPPSHAGHAKHCRGHHSQTDRKRPYPCNLCPSRFGSKMELEEHQNSHTGMKPFECEVCKARFNRRSTLWNHKRIHSDAKPFVCTVCQMTFKWKNSLKCHKEMHLRKNESSAGVDNDLRQLTYATAARRNRQQAEEEAAGAGGTVNGTSGAVASAPIANGSPSKKKSSHKPTSVHAANSAVSSAASVPFSQSIPISNLAQMQQLPLHAASLVGPPADHSLDLDTSSLDTLVSNPSNSHLLFSIQNFSCNGDTEPFELGPHAASLISQRMELPNNGLLGEIKSEGQLLQSPMSAAPAPLNVQLNSLPLVRNVLDFQQLAQHQQLPSVHHLTTSTSQPSVQVDYSTHGSSPDSLSSNASLHQPHYIAISQPDMMLSQPSVTYQQQYLQDSCVLIQASQEYRPNYENYMVPDTNSAYVPASESQQNMNGGQAADNDATGKVLPYEQW